MLIQIQISKNIERIVKMEKREKEDISNAVEIDN